MSRSLCFSSVSMLSSLSCFVGGRGVWVGGCMGGGAGCRFPSFLAGWVGGCVGGWVEGQHNTAAIPPHPITDPQCNANHTGSCTYPVDNDAIGHAALGRPAAARHHHHAGADPVAGKGGEGQEVGEGGRGRRRRGGGGCCYCPLLLLLLLLLLSLAWSCACAASCHGAVVFGREGRRGKTNATDWASALG